MSAAGPRTRLARGRVVIVGPVPDLRGYSGRLVAAEDLFDAVGQVTVAGASEPIAAVVVPAGMVEGPASIAVEAFRRIDPSVRVIALAATDAEHARLTAAPNGFDRVLREPLSPSGLAEALDEEEVAPRERDRAEPGAGPAREIAPPRGAPRQVSFPGEPRLVESIEVGPVSEAPPAGDLGDTDLVQAILTDPRGVRETALELMVQQTGWTDLALVEEQPAAPAPGAGAAAAEVRSGNRCFGILSTARAEARKLAPWAQWLARWMSLDQAYRDYREMAYRDDLTGAWNRRYYGAFMGQVLPRAARARRPVTVLFFDIDDFKQYNDRFGHEAGDEILKETVRLLESVVRGGDRVCRIGGDEFVVVFYDQEGPRTPGSNPPESVEQIATRFQEQIWGMKFPKLGLDAPGTLSISGGLSTYPWDGHDPESLLRYADQLALQSKRKGKNVITLGPGAERLRRERDAPPR